MSLNNKYPLSLSLSLTYLSAPMPSKWAHRGWSLYNLLCGYHCLCQFWLCFAHWTAEPLAALHLQAAPSVPHTLHSRFISVAEE